MSQEIADEKARTTGRRERNAEARRQQILWAARVLLSRGGLGALSMRKLAEEASLSVNTLYNLWGTQNLAVERAIRRSKRSRPKRQEGDRN
jgi:AcrR family transcriptional regulator